MLQLWLEGTWAGLLSEAFAKYMGFGLAALGLIAVVTLIGESQNPNSKGLFGATLAVGIWYIFLMVLHLDWRH